MERLGFIHDILDVKVLILYVMTLVETPVSAQTIYEFCYQDESLSYFDVQESIPQMVQTGHLERLEGELYRITEKGRAAEEVTADSIAFPVRERARVAVETYNRNQKREQFLHSEIQKQEDGEYTVRMVLRDHHGTLMDLTLAAPSLQQARRLETAYRRHAEIVYRSVMISLLEDLPGSDTEN